MSERVQINPEDQPGIEVSSEIVMPGMCNQHHTLFGGFALQMMDIAAGLAAQRYCKSAVVTAKMDEVNFKAPILEGETAVVQAITNWRGQTSIGVNVFLYKEDIEGKRTECTNAKFTMVCVGANLRSRLIVCTGCKKIGCFHKCDYNLVKNDPKARAEPPI